MSKTKPRKTHKRFPKVSQAPPPIDPIKTGSHSFNKDFRSRPVEDWRYWGWLDKWTIGQAVCLLCDSDPYLLENLYHPLKPRLNYQGSRAQKLRQMYDIANAAIEAGRLEILETGTHGIYRDISPAVFIAWVKRRRLPIPDQLASLEVQEPIVEADIIDAGYQEAAADPEAVQVFDADSSMLKEAYKKLGSNTVDWIKAAGNELEDFCSAMQEVRQKTPDFDERGSDLVPGTLNVEALLYLENKKPRPKYIKKKDLCEVVETDDMRPEIVRKDDVTLFDGGTVDRRHVISSLIRNHFGIKKGRRPGVKKMYQYYETITGRS